MITLMKTYIYTLTYVLTITSQASLLITGVVDGTQSGGNPKAIELVSTIDGTNLSDFYLLRDTNGSSGTFTQSSSLQLPMFTLDAGEFFYIYGTAETETFLENLGIGDTSSNAVFAGIAGHNGDDIFALSSTNDTTGIIDAYGLLGQGDTDFGTDSIVYRNANEGANATGVLDAGNFTVTGYSDQLLEDTFGTFVIPEPSTTALAGLGLLALLRRKRA